MKSPRTAAALVIGNELLSGKVRESNVAFLGKTLFALGIVLRRVIMCPDEAETIAADLDQLRRAHDYVFTSGGVGPTHDDVTIDGVARAFGRRRVRDPTIEALLRAHYAERVTEHHLRMADLPEGASLVSTGGARWPTVRLENVFVLPGVPAIFRRKVENVRGELRGGPPFVSRSVLTHSDEGEVAAVLGRIGERHPEVAIGSYPRWADGGYRLTVTFDGRVPARVDEAVEELLRALPREQIISAGTGS